MGSLQYIQYKDIPPQRLERQDGVGKKLILGCIMIMSQCSKVNNCKFKAQLFFHYDCIILYD